MHEDLLGYLLNALDADEQHRIEELLEKDPSLRRELQRLRRCLGPLESLQEEMTPPADLAGRTCDMIARHAAVNRPTPRSVLDRQPIAAAPQSARFSRTEGVVVALVCMVAFTLFLPALANSRYQARKSLCQDNLRALANGLISYSEQQGSRRFPFVPETGNRSFAGLFASTLVEHQLLNPHSAVLICPGSDLAQQGTRVFVPSLEQVDQADGPCLIQLQNRAGGSYAFSVGYFENGHYRAVRNYGRAHFALLADAPSLHLAGRRSASHGARGQNICYEDGHITFVINEGDVFGDDPLRNRFGYAEVGVDRDDAVVLPSGMRPIVDTGSLRVIDSFPLE